MHGSKSYLFGVWTAGSEQMIAGLTRDFCDPVVCEATDNATLASSPDDKKGAVRLAA